MDIAELCVGSHQQNNNRTISTFSIQKKWLHPSNAKPA